MDLERRRMVLGRISALVLILTLFNVGRYLSSYDMLIRLLIRLCYLLQYVQD